MIRIIPFFLERGTFLFSMSLDSRVFPYSTVKVFEELCRAVILDLWVGCVFELPFEQAGGIFHHGAKKSPLVQILVGREVRCLFDTKLDSRVLCN